MDQFQGFLFDLNGTMINDMPYHVKAWHTILNYLGADISMEQTKEECYGKNNELLERIFPGRFTDEEKRKMSFEKEKSYRLEFAPFLRLINGLDDFLKGAHEKKIKMGIGSAAIMDNVNFVLDGLNIRNYFSALVSADDVKKSKPDPETFLKCADIIGIAPGECLVFEDAPKGVEAAMNAGMKAIVILTMHEKGEFNSYPNVLFCINDFKDERLKELTGSL
ncbi:MAG: HAD family phosphatase [Bacteroidia bacterium]|nr:HAD family phosphatase [Bacteroidia bacterium]